MGPKTSAHKGRITITQREPKLLTRVRGYQSMWDGKGYHLHWSHSWVKRREVESIGHWPQLVEVPVIKDYFSVIL